MGIEIPYREFEVEPAGPIPEYHPEPTEQPSIPDPAPAEPAPEAEPDVAPVEPEKVSP